MKPHKFFYKLLDILTVLCLLVFFASFGFKDSKSSGWYQQWFPNMNGSTIASLTFLDSLTGYAVTSTNSSVQAYILKTTNGGNNWSIIYTYIPPSTNSGFTKIQFANSSIGYASTNYYDFFKTTNGGVNWIQLTTPWGGDDMAIINSDTILLTDYAAIMGGIYRSTNGGSNWQLIWAAGGTNNNSNKIYMFNKNIGFQCLDNDLINPIYKTTNGGVNWFTATGGPFHDIKFSDSLSGWKTLDSIKKTTNGGLTWVGQQIPYYNLFFGGHSKLSIINIDSLWFVGGYKYLNGFYYGIIYKTTNSGNNWGYQIPDTSFHIGGFYKINFVNKNIGWAYSSELVQSEVHTIVGGSDTTFYTGVSNNIKSVPKDYVLFQNYPNPFNSMTNVKVQMSKQGFAEIKVYDISGKLIKSLLNQNLYSGEHKVSFNAIDLTSGVYLYTLFVDGNRIDTKKAILIK
jgi:photosystem II stability/assembly factor-like uncharacterized protein